MRVPARWFIAVAALLLSAWHCSAQQITVAAAADLTYAMSDLAAQFQKQGGGKVEVVFGSSGSFFTQLGSGAPFDLFFSADTLYPIKLQSARLTEPGTLFEYAQGHLVIWAPEKSSLIVSQGGWNTLLDERVKKIAIANPEHAPYGRAAVEALKKAGIYEKVKDKLVLGENISQAAQFVQSGNAQEGIIALSLAISPTMKAGKKWDVPAEMYSPIKQSAVMLKSSKNKDAARAFLEFVKSSKGREILEQTGFTIPTPAP